VGSEGGLPSKLLHSPAAWMVVRLPCPENRCVPHLAGGSKAALPGGGLLYPAAGWVEVRLPCLGENCCIPLGHRGEA